MDTELARIEGGIELGEELALASGKPERQITFTFGRPDVPSENRDFLAKGEIEKVADRLQTQAIDLQHNASLTIGAFASGIRFVKQADGEFCAADGKLWTWRYPEEVEAVSQAYAKGLLAGSWVMGFGGAICSECSEEFGPNQTYPALYQHLRDKHGGKGHRILRDLDPRGAAILLKHIDQPGYLGTRVLALAAKTREEVVKMADPDETKKKSDGNGGGEGNAVSQAALAAVAELGTLKERFAKLEADQKALTDERDALKTKVAEREQADAIAAKAPERMTAFKEAVKKKFGDAYTVAQELLDKVTTKAAKLADDAWGEFATDAVDLLQAPAGTAIAKKVGSGNDPAPHGGTKQPDDGSKHPLPKLHAALVGQGDDDEEA